MVVVESWRSHRPWAADNTDTGTAFQIWLSKGSKEEKI